jgi:hypothetical protein
MKDLEELQEINRQQFGMQLHYSPLQDSLSWA